MGSIIRWRTKRMRRGRTWCRSYGLWTRLRRRNRRYRRRRRRHFKDLHNPWYSSQISRWFCHSQHCQTFRRKRRWTIFKLCLYPDSSFNRSVGRRLRERDPQLTCPDFKSTVFRHDLYNGWASLSRLRRNKSALTRCSLETIFNIRSTPAWDILICKSFPVKHDTACLCQSDSFCLVITWIECDSVSNEEFDRVSYIKSFTYMQWNSLA